MNNTEFKRRFEYLTDAQKSAVLNISDNLIITAGPGAGKTELLSMRCANILQNTDLYPSNILLLTFTNAGVKAMKDRLVDIIGLDGYDIHVYTFHSFASKIISENIEVSYILKDRVQITDVEKYQLIEYLLDNLSGIDAIRPFYNNYSYVQEIVSTISALKKEGYTPESLNNNFYNTEYFYPNLSLKSEDEKLKSIAKYKERWEAFKIIYTEYEKALINNTFFKHKGRYDYDDIINIAKISLNENPDLKSIFKEQYQYIMIDEFQDTNGSQIQLFFSICDKNFTNVCIVGDDDQSIYRFQGANLTNYTLLEDFLGEGNFKNIYLDINHRSSADIINLSSSLINTLPYNLRKAKPKISVSVKNLDLKTDDIKVLRYENEIAEMFGIKDLILNKLTYIDINGERKGFDGIAILCRKNSIANKIAQFFKEENIPFVLEGKENLFNVKIVRQLVGILNMFYDFSRGDIDDKLLFEILNYDFFNISQFDLQNLILEYKYTKDKKKSQTKKEKINFNKKQLSIDYSSDDYYILNFYTYLLDVFNTNKLLLNINNFEDLINKNDKSIAYIISAFTYFIRNINTLPVDIFVLQLIQVFNINDYLLSNYDKYNKLDFQNINGLASFVNHVKQRCISNPKFNMEDFVNELDILEKYNIPFEGVLSQNMSNSVHIMTIHSAKGLEFDNVIIPSVLDNVWLTTRNDGIQIPSDILKQIKPTDYELRKKMNEADEKRLLYVAISRAKENIYFTVNEVKKNNNSRVLKFLYELNIPIEDVSIKDLSNKIIDNTDVFNIDKVKNTKDILQDIANNFVLSPTSLVLYRTCPRKFLYRSLLETPSSKNQSNIFGSTVHFALEKSFLSYIKFNKLFSTQEFIDTFLFALDLESADELIRQRCKSDTKLKNLKNWYEYYIQNVKNNKKPYKLEYHSQIIINNKKYFSGICDKIEYDDNDSKCYIVVDYKTGKSSDHTKNILAIIDSDLKTRKKSILSMNDEMYDEHLIQLIAYKMLVEHDFKGKRVKKGRLVYIDPVDKDIKKINVNKDDFLILDVDLYDNMVTSLKRFIDETYDKIRALQFEKRDIEKKDVCEYCEYKDICGR